MRAHLLFVLAPYSTVVLLCAGLIVRYAWLRNRIESISPDLRGMRSLFHFRAWLVSLLLLALGHIGGMLFPRQILRWNASPQRLYFLEGFAFLIGLYCLLGWGYFLWKHFAQNHGSITTEIADTAFLSLISVGLLSGLLTAALHRWSSSWAVVTLAPYLDSLLRGKPAVTLVSGMPFFVQLHLLSAIVAVGLFPFTRLALPLFLLVRRIEGYVLRPVEAAAQSARRALESWVRRYDPTHLIWPEEED